MRLTGVELRRVSLPLVAPFRTSHGTQLTRDALLVTAFAGGTAGYGECVADAVPDYSPEYTDGAAHVIRHHLLGALAGDVDAHTVERRLTAVAGHPMAKAALCTAVLDVQLRRAGMSFGSFLGAVRDRVECGVSVGIMDSIPELLDAVGAYLADGYRRIKLKIEPGWDVAPVAAVRDRHGDIPLQVDANAAYRLSDARHLTRLDAFDLLLLEQPLPADDLRGHAALARLLRTPICLDESITSARAAADAIALGATAIVNVKPGRVGGYIEARRVHDVCAAHGVPVWCGGMLETGLGRAANLALAALPNFTLPNDTSASARYYHRDLTAPFTLTNGHLPVPTTPGLGVTPDPEALKDLTTHTELLPL